MLFYYEKIIKDCIVFDKENVIYKGKKGTLNSLCVDMFKVDDEEYKEWISYVLRIHKYETA
jgi:hypothetical protein